MKLYCYKYMCGVLIHFLCVWEDKNDYSSILTYIYHIFFQFIKHIQYSAYIFFKQKMYFTLPYVFAYFLWNCNMSIVPPTLNAFTVDSNLRLGQRVSMLCSAIDGDLPMRITWLRNDIPLSGSSTGGMSGNHRRGSEGISITEIGDYESVLRIDNLRPKHNANFTCMAQNDGGKAQHSQTLRVKGRQYMCKQLLTIIKAHRSHSLHYFLIIGALQLGFRCFNVPSPRFEIMHIDALI